MKKRFYVTQEGMRELQLELEGLVAHRGIVAEHLKAARELGDQAENAQYISARQDQEKLEARIVQIESIIRNAQVVKRPKSTSLVRLGSVIRLKNRHESKEFQIVGTVEANPFRGKISDESPIGKVLLGKRVGDEVEIKTPMQTTVYRVMYIS